MIYIQTTDTLLSSERDTWNSSYHKREFRGIFPGGISCPLYIPAYLHSESDTCPLFAV